MQTVQRLLSPLHAFTRPAPAVQLGTETPQLTLLGGDTRQGVGVA